MSLIQKNDVVLFQGDSVTDVGRSRTDDKELGSGYSNKISSYLSTFCADLNATVLNRGVSGDRVRDLQARWQEDCLDLKPNIVNILIGVNDTWRRYDRNDPTSADDFEASYREILEKTKASGALITMIEPFMLPYPADHLTWREDLDEKIHRVRGLAKEFAAVYIPMDGMIASYNMTCEPKYYSADGVHPSDAGHALIAKIWLKAVGVL